MRTEEKIEWRDIDVLQKNSIKQAPNIIIPLYL